MDKKDMLFASGWPILAVAGILALWGCEDSQTGIYDVEETVPETRISNKNGGPPFDPTEAMTTAIQDEYHAQFTYGRVLADLGEDTNPFANIVLAEIQHVASIATLFTDRGWDVPTSVWDLENVPTFPTRVEACQGGVDGELENIAIYEELLTLELPLDVQEVFLNLQAASQDHHLPAFEECSVIGGVEAMDIALQKEYHSRFTYEKVLADLGDITPFNSIVEAEAQHVASISELYVKRELPVPASTWNMDNVPTFESRTEACLGGVGAELEQIATYEDLFDFDLPTDVRNVFVNLRAASEYNHLPAFEACAEVVQKPTDYLTLAIQDEYRMQAVYAKIIDDLGEIDPFTVIVEAEAQHVSELAVLFTNKGWDVPVSEWADPDLLPAYSSKGEACIGALALEIANVAMYDTFLLELGLAPDVRAAFERLREASYDHHLPAFTLCAS